MKTIDLKKAMSPLATYTSGLKRGALIVMSKGKPVAALVRLPPNTDWESFSLSTNPDFIRMIENARKQVKKTGGVPLKSVRERFELK